MMAQLTKTQFLLDDCIELNVGDVIFQRAEYIENRINSITVPQSVWAELGAPDKITVTIEPGDTLNEEG
jgi:hypothetical protein